MEFKRNKKGQAAIEFLMTYGWMLLVVLIVGALIFSFVDFGSLLPNKLDLSNNLRGDPTGSLARSGTNDVKVVFKYNGPKRVLIGLNGAIIKTDLGEKCYAIELQNLNVPNGVVNATSINITGSSVEYSTTGTGSLAFLNGQEGIMTYDCNRDNTLVNYGGTGTHGVSNGLLQGDSIVGTVTIPVVDPMTKLDIPSSGPIRLKIN